VAHVQYTSDIGRRDDNGIGLAGGALIGGKQFFLLPVIIPAFFNCFGRVALVQHISAHEMALLVQTGPAATLADKKEKGINANPRLWLFYSCCRTWQPSVLSGA
jgi:hypothetical protein